MSRNPIPLMTVLLCLSIMATAQKSNDYRILLRGSSFTPEKNISITNAAKLNSRALPVAGRTFTVIQFDHIPTQQERTLLTQSGIDLLEYIPNNAYTASVKGSLNIGVLNLVKARSIIDLTPEQKMFPALAAKRFPISAIKIPGTIDVWVSFPKTFSFETVISELKAKNIDILSDEFKNYRVIALRVSQQKLNELASLSCIEYVQPAPGEDRPLNDKDVVNSRASVLKSSLGRNLDGKGVVIGVGDNADPLQHIDFAGRLINRAALVGQSHGVHVMGTAAGAGIVSEKYTGYASKATIVSQAFSGILAGAPSYVNDYGMVVTNNSYGNSTDCSSFGVYDIYSQVLDEFAFDMPNLQNVFAAGNSGDVGNVCGPYPGGFGTVFGSYQTAKNVLTVGATTDQGASASFSSKGPVLDGRIKPEITTQGAPVVSTIPINGYGSNQGTSMASPGAAGGLTLLYQRYKQLHGGANPENALMKALLCNGATDEGNIGPDYSFGFGWMNLLHSVKMMENNNYFNSTVANSVTNTHTITVAPNTAQLKVMLYWNDPPAAVLAAHTLVNDLDLEVADPSSTVTLPYILDTIPSNILIPATHGADHVNNIEQVVINNPVAGTYTVSVKGTAINQNPNQEYFLVYDTIPVSTTLTYPIGGEKLTAGDFIYVSWESYGNPGNNFTVEYSINDGISWSPVPPGTASASTRQLGWTIPVGFTDQARVKVTHNGTGEVSISERFTIVGVPVVSLAAVQCEGYIAINWTSIPEATGYEVMMLRGDAMASVATVPAAQTNYTFSGLSKDSVYWVTVRSILNANPGRRAIAISRQPNNGTCAGTISDNDLKADAVLAPLSGRQFTTSALGAATVISARIKNLDDAAINNFNIKYSVNGAPFVSETNLSAVAAGGTYTHNFAATYDFSAVGVYQLRIVVQNTSAADPVSANDTLTVSVKQLSNTAITLVTDFLDDLESADSAAYYSRQVGLGNRDRYDFVSNTIYGRLRTFVNSGIAYSGSKALTLDADRFNGGTTDSLTGTFNLGTFNAATDDIRLDFRFKHHAQAPDAANNVWIRGDDQKPWIKVYDLYANQGDPGVFNKSSSIELGDVLSTNGQNFSTSFQVRWGQWGQILTADNETGAGYTFDDIHLYKVTDDIQMVSIDTPIVASCGLGSAVPLKVTVRNSSNTTINSIPVSFKVDGGATITTETISTLNGNTSFQYLFTATVDLSAPGAHKIQVWVDYPFDTYRANDTAVVQLYNSPIIASFPYLQNFEADNGFWYTNGKKSSWQYGTPASQKINRAASGSKAWKTTLVGNYNDLEESYLYSPCFDISGMATPTLSFSVALDLEDCGSGSLCDAAYVEYSADGNTWTKLGAYGAGTNWYNKNFTGNNANVWSIQDYTRWHVATIPLPTGFNRLRLRFVMSSDPYTSREGIAVDDIHIYDNIYGIYNGATMGAPVTQTISGGTSWIDFTTGGKLVASVMPNNLSMGSTDVQAYINTGPVRTSSNQYYHNRNITIKPATVNLSDSVTVRFYFLDTETETLINAVGCGVCSKPTTAYDLGVSKYSDPTVAIENGTLTDDILGNWLYIAPPDVVKVPFDKGYYAEYKVKNFSEFWLNNGGPDQLQVLPVSLLKFTVNKKTNDDVLVEWTSAQEINVDRYEIEIAKGYQDYQQSNFVKAGTVISRNNSSSQQYEFTDAEKNKTGVRYYRLKIIDKDGKYVYSAVRPVVFDTEIKWQVYPNPSDGLFSFVYQVNDGEKMTVKVYDADARLIKEFSAVANGFVQKASINIQAARYAPGLYLIETSTGEKKQLFRVIKQ